MKLHDESMMSAPITTYGAKSTGASQTPQHPVHANGVVNKRWILSLGALGIVYGDIGTSPLYALRECFHGPHGFPVTSMNVLGVLSLMIWSLLLVISFKYLIVVLRADNKGEGGILALMALIKPADASLLTFRRGLWVVLIGIFGAALLYGDGMITPAISVLSAIEGLQIATPLFTPYVIPITVAILIGLFMIQSRGTQGIGFLFGPVTLLWFVVLGILGIYQILSTPTVLQAFHPWYAISFFVHNGFHGMYVLGAVFLVVTGGEALYADLGHFGRTPIRLAWFTVVLPCLVFNYLGQGALLLQNPKTAANPFYLMAPSWALYPLVLLATAATIIASQAVITGVFSLTMQAVQLDYLPRMEIRYTSEETEGQIYVPLVNWLLLLSTLGLVVGFGSSSRLAAAYGVAVATTMVLTTILLFVVMRRLWRWRLVWVLPLVLFFLLIDLAFLVSTLSKIGQGGWFSLLLAAWLCVVMMTWRKGRQLLRQSIEERTLSLDAFFRMWLKKPPLRPEGTAVYMVSNAHSTPPAMIYNYQHNGVIHKQILLVTVHQENLPYVEESRRFTVQPFTDGFFRVHVFYGFMDTPNIPQIIQCIGIEHHKIKIDMDQLTYVLGKETILATKKPGMSFWREKLFAFLSHNAQSATRFFRLPPAQVIEIGAQVEL